MRNSKSIESLYLIKQRREWGGLPWVRIKSFFFNLPAKAQPYNWPPVQIPESLWASWCVHEPKKLHGDCPKSRLTTGHPKCYNSTYGPSFHSDISSFHSSLWNNQPEMISSPYVLVFSSDGCSDIKMILLILFPTDSDRHLFSQLDISGAEPCYLVKN